MTSARPSPFAADVPAGQPAQPVEATAAAASAPAAGACDAFASHPSLAGPRAEREGVPAGSGLPAAPPREGNQLEPGWLGLDGSWPTHGAVVVFTSPVCAPCRAVKIRLNLATSRLAQAGPAPQVVEVDVSRQLAVGAAFGVTRTPTVLLVSAQGVVVARLAEVVPPQAWWLQALSALAAASK